MKPWASDASVAQEVWEWTENKIAEIQMGMQDKTEASPQCHEAQHVKTLKKLDPDSPLKMAGKEDEEKDWDHGTVTLQNRDLQVNGRFIDV
eukprot:CAMPEP_0173102696 /NCGR_PEP_ID=MMETSP1102-20130122/37785_1 /TAXON_ID=49646 /ORGANISM="Geminigera sp., Strain Caron Lab Isolate" /LENGTH=90 /DNA_ID=CAMNT_0013997043 /DNA_START=530 /DNA_END=800 /DNA_ORIENTATION=-